MHDYIIQRVIEISEHMINTGETVREISKRFGVSKSTVHKDLVERLPMINTDLYEQVRDVLEKNKNERHLRGGESTRLKYMIDEKDGKLVEIIE
ncbi:sporulation transcriptional regulator SpoIIID [Alkalicella caledoniensis]|uniref:Sporulation transcriptional regulator SpoIIID n=1 Tax=Alkalicella caledoniensis TaxID=2731377 RepID=A0A7G9W919_ALKCA|nr:sporulation transcriptional regulator SpoIIID [Alkalicella caledoniensis]QNO15181.1 sporulation transcriptional regulator SpoIIID [Alkalicella caledoniensis]